MSFTYEFPKVADLTASFALFCFDTDEVFILLGKRKSTKAFPNAWCIPGGYLNEGELLKECAIRELREETGVDVPLTSVMFVDVFDDLNRDPRGRVIDHVYTAVIDKCLLPDLSHPECDLEDAQWFPVSKLADMQLAFDHNKSLREAYLKVLRI